jgi:betaine lipid synthase
MFSAGGDAQYGAKRSRSGLIQRIRSMDRMESLKGMQQDLTVLKSIWFKKASGSDHAERLESFYGPQAAACEL